MPKLSMLMSHLVLSPALGGLALAQGFQSVISRVPWNSLF